MERQFSADYFMDSDTGVSASDYSRTLKSVHEAFEEISRMNIPAEKANISKIKKPKQVREGFYAKMRPKRSLLEFVVASTVLFMLAAFVFVILPPGLNFVAVAIILTPIAIRIKRDFDDNVRYTIFNN